MQTVNIETRLPYETPSFQPGISGLDSHPSSSDTYAADVNDCKEAIHYAIGDDARRLLK